MNHEPRLSIADVRVLDALADSVNPNELVQKFGVAPRTVKTRIRRLRLMLGLSDCHPSIVLAIWWAKVPELARLGATEVPIDELRDYYQQAIAP